MASKVVGADSSRMDNIRLCHEYNYIAFQSLLRKLPLESYQDCQITSKFQQLLDSDHFPWSLRWCFSLLHVGKWKGTLWFLVGFMLQEPCRSCISSLLYGRWSSIPSLWSQRRLLLPMDRNSSPCRTLLVFIARANSINFRASTLPSKALCTTT